MSSGGPTILRASAPAKVNLTLRVGARRADGYHEIESLVVFAQPQDDLELAIGEPLALSIDGPTAAAAGQADDNLVLKASRALAGAITGLTLGHFHLHKQLPVAAGLGGGSSDAAAALRLLAKANRLAADDNRLAAAARRTGADVPVCLDPRPRLMRGAGETLSPPVPLPPLAAVLVNPGVAVSTAEVFARLAAARDGMPQKIAADAVSALVEEAVATDRACSEDALIAALEGSRNDLEMPAIALQPVIGQALLTLRELPGCRLARMSGSGATCFGLFDRGSAAAAAQVLKTQHPLWWVQASGLGVA